ncbi:DUF4292 domain-containing protein [Sediminibacterium ginsengisoli]|uniref:DUF4292 domain-containing protein n=1 Tax=Sediminibacterium ginsengisoli TaxID=413434 RepID=A0A1T4N320_9BACT|nr:DUF4292 domain-containing protein [Sediminibacterium ginsengisoli]SJZ73524.1 protein of unknown function [Sediminibacterium ginsengisoli]
MKQAIFIISVLLVSFSCKTVKKVQNIQTAMVRKDTAQAVIIKEAPKVDSAAIVEGIMSKVAKSKIDFKTFNAKIKVDYDGAERSDNYTAYLSMRKDSVILIKVAGKFLGISKVGLQVKITKDSVVLVKMVDDKSVMYRAISYLQEETQIPFDFYTMQDMIIGNPIFITGNLISYKNLATQLLVLVNGDVFKHLVTLDINDSRILHSKLDDVNIQRNRTCDITFGNYQQMGPYLFAANRKISVAEKSKLDITLDFKEFSLNEPLKYTFEIPKNYKRK